MSADFDTIVIGAGQAGPGVASTLVGRGERVALIEAVAFGGTCLNSGCRPTKILRASARAAHVARTSAHLGVYADNVWVSLPEVIARKNRLVDGWRSGSEDYYRDLDGLTVYDGHARFAAPVGDLHVVTVGDHELRAPRVVLNTGARSVPPPIPGLDTIAWLDHHGILDLTELPRHLVVLGGSYIGLELGQIFSRYGAEVTILERSERLVGREDPEISDAIADFLRTEGIDVLTGVEVSSVESDGTGVRVHLPGRTLDASHVLVAAGRVPNSDDLGLDVAGVETDERGYVITDEVFATTVPGIYAVGDVNGRGAFTHTSYQDYEILVDHLDGGSRTVAGRVATYALFTDPPLGRVGLTETQCRERGLTVEVSTYPMESLTRAVIDGETEGVFKLITDPATDRIVGAALLGLHGDEIVQSLSLMMHADVPASALATWLPVHPTVAEFLPTIYARRAPD